MFSLENQIAIVTGASRGIGRATAVMLARLGADVFVHYNNSLQGAEETASEIEKIGRKAYLIKADVSKNEDVKNMFEFISKNSRKVDILVNNAGKRKVNYIRSTSEEDWRDIIDTNLTGSFLCSKCCLRYMMPAGQGSIVNVSSVAAYRPGVAHANYASAKAGLIAMTKSMAVELGRFNIRVNAVAPGPTRTDMNLFDEKEEARLNKIIPLGRIGEGEDVARAISYFCTPFAEYLTGQVLIVDGGFSIP